MIRNLKVLGLALVAVFAMSAMAAVGAQAQQGVLTSDGPFTLKGEDEGTLGEAQNYFEYNATLGKVECTTATYVGEKLNSSSQLAASGETTATVTPTYPAHCTVTGVTATVTMNGCHYVFHINETTPETTDEYGVTADLVCPAEKDVEVHVYASATKETIQTCKVTIKAQNGLKGLDIGNELKAGTTETVVPHVLTVTGQIEGITASKSGLCGGGETAEAKLKATVTLKGINGAEELTPVTLSHS